MITQTGGAGNYVYRDSWGDYPSNTESWTVFFYAKYNVTPVGQAQIWDIFNNSGSQNVFVGNVADSTSEIGLEVTNTAGTVSTVAAVTISTNTSIPVAVIYDTVGHTAALYVSNTLVGSTSVNFGTSSWNNMEFLGGGAGAADVSVGYLRAWQRKLTLTELIAETSSITPATTANIIFSNPCQTAIDLTDHILNDINHLLPVGTVITHTTDPLLSITAGPPSNTSPALATTCFTTSAIFADVVSGTAATTTWWKCTASVGAKCLLFGVYGNTPFNPAITMYEGLTNAQGGTVLLSISANPNTPVRFPVDEGVEYYGRVTSAATTPAVLEVSFLQSLALSVPAGSIGINDDTENYPCAFLSGVGAPYPISYKHDVVAGEGGDVLDSGTLLLTGENMVATSTMEIWNPTMTSKTTINTAPTVISRVSSNHSTRWLGSGGPDPVTGDACLVFINGDGTLGDFFNPTGAVGFWSLGMLPNESRAYFVTQNLAAMPVRTWDLSANTTASNLMAGIANYFPCKDILCLDNNTVVVGHARVSGTTSVIVRVVNTSGTVQTTIDISSYAGGNETRQFRMCRGTNNPTTFVVWVKGPVTGKGTFLEINAVGGTVTEMFPGPLLSEFYEVGKYEPSSNSTPQRDGPSQSCPVWITRGVIPPIVVTARSGIYFLDFGKRNDTLWIDAFVGTTENVAIP